MLRTKNCADCVYHICKLQCMQKPRLPCDGYCKLKYDRKKCDTNTRTCLDFEQIDWS